MNGLWRKADGRRWKTGPSFPQLVKNLWITVENKCSEWSCTQKKGLGTHFLPTDHEYPVEKKIVDACKCSDEKRKKIPQSMKGLWTKNRRGWSRPSPTEKTKKSPQSVKRMWRKTRVILSELASRRIYAPIRPEMFRQCEDPSTPLRSLGMTGLVCGIKNLHNP